MRTKLRATLAGFLLLPLVSQGASSCGCTEAATSTVVQAEATGDTGKTGDQARKPKPKGDKKPCKKKGDRKGSATETKKINKGTFKTRAEAEAARAKDMKNNDPRWTRMRDECSPKKCHLHLDLYSRNRPPGNDDGPLETWHYTHHRR